MDLTVLNLALPTLSADLQPSSSELLWIVDIYGFLVAGLLITMGTLGDRIGRRRLLLIGGAAFGVASVLGAIGTAVYRGQVADAVPAGVPPGAAKAARDTLGGAVAAGQGLPDPLAADLLDAAREAFTQGLQLAATLSAALTIAAAVLAAALLQRVRAGPASEPQETLEADRAPADGALC
jgi:MFS family permease